jgi:hypothetical protein
LLKEFDEVENCLVLTETRTRSAVEKVINAYQGDWGVKMRDGTCLLLNVPVFTERLASVALGTISMLVRNLVPGPLVPPELRLTASERACGLDNCSNELREICQWLVGLTPELP